MKSNTEFPEGFDLPHGNLEKNANMFDSFLIPRERAKEIQNFVSDLFMKNTAEGIIKTSTVIVEVAKLCRTPSELALALLGVGYIVHSETLSPRVISIQIGQRSPGKSAPTGEDPTIDELIRKSYEINGGNKE